MAARQHTRGSRAAPAWRVLLLATLHTFAGADSSAVCMGCTGGQLDVPEPAVPDEIGAVPDEIGMLQTRVDMSSAIQPSGLPSLPPGPYGSPMWNVSQAIPNPLLDFLVEFIEHPSFLSTARAVESMGAVAGHFAVKHKGLLPVYLLSFVGIGALLLLVALRVDRMATQQDTPKLEDAPETKRETEESASASVQSSVGSRPGPVPEQPQKADVSVSFFQLFRYATGWECFLMVLAIIFSMIQGACMPISFVRLEEVLTVLHMPNDDGSAPPAAGPHAQRDAEVKRLTVFFLWLGIVGATCRGVAWYLSANLAERQYTRVKIALFKKMMSVGPAWYDIHSPTEAATILSSETYVFRQGIGEELIDLSRSSVFFVIGMVAIFVLNWRAAMLQVSVLPVAIMALGILAQTMTKSRVMLGKFGVDASSVLASTLSAPRTVAAFNGQERALKAHGKCVESLCFADRLGFYQGCLVQFARAACQTSALTLAIFWQSFVVLRDFENECWASAAPFGSCANGSSILAVNYTLGHIAPTGIGPIPQCLERIQGARVAAKRIYDLLDEKTTTPRFGKTSLKVKGHIEYKSVTFTYPSRPQVAVISDFTLSVEAGTSCAFVGPSGSGKSVLIELLLRFYSPQGGQVLLDGEDLQGLGLAWLRSKMSLVEQEPILFAGTVLENIKRGSLITADFRQVERAAKLADAHDFVASLEKGYDTDLGELGVGLSGGQKQRIAISRALIRDPAVLLLDEATSALDAESERAVQKALDKLIGGSFQDTGRRTTLIIAHRLSTVRSVSKICVLRDGRFVEHGSPAKLASNPSSAYSQLVALQATEGAASLVDDAADQSGDAQPSTDQESKKIEEQGSISNKDAASANSDRRTPDKVTKESDLQPVPMSRVWRYAAADAHLYLLGVFAGILGVSMMPVYLITLCTTVHSLDRPPVAFDDMSRTWVPIYNSEVLISGIIRRCFVLPFLGCLADLAMASTTMFFKFGSINLTRRMFRITFGALLKQDIEWQEKQSVGLVRDRIASDVPMMKTLTGDSLAMLLVLGLSMVIISGIACIHSWRLYLTTLAGILLPLVGTVVFYAFSVRSHVDQTAGFVTEALAGIRTVSAFSCENELEDRFGRMVREESKQMLKSNIPGSICMAGNTFGWIFYIGGICFFSGRFIGHGVLNPDTASIMLFICMGMVGTLGLANAFAGDQTLANEAAKRIFAIIDRQPVIDSSSPNGLKPMSMLGTVQFCNVSFSYTGSSIRILDNFDLVVEFGSAVALVGLSGCGKSSALGLVFRFFDPTSGSVNVDGRDIRTLNIRWLREHMSLVQQEPVLFAGSIEENIQYGKEGATSEQVLAVAKLAQASEFINKLVDGYQTDVGSRGTKLSGGQKQRIAIARALVRKPSVLLLDEATSALDAVSEKLVMDELYRRRDEESMTMMIVAHRLCTVQNADKIGVMSKGAIVEMGKHAELMQNVGGHYYRLVQLQACKAH